MQTSISRRTLAQQWAKFSALPGGKSIFSWGVGRMAPYTGSIGADVIELADGHAKVQLRDRRKVRNHLGSVHAIALMNLGEVATGLAVMHSVDGRGRGIITHLAMDYVKKARGTLTATCSTELPTELGNLEHECTAEIHDESGELVARATARWRLQIEA
jgi:uncharacterized protein (TIGR00369 family)